MKQKATLIFLAAALVLSLLTGCPASDGNSVIYSDKTHSSVAAEMEESLSSAEPSDRSSSVPDHSSIETDAPGTSNGPFEITGVSDFSLSSIEAYHGSAYTAVNGNTPYFTSSDLTTESFELYSDLDSLGRCGTAYACIGLDLMPDEERGSIGSVKPTGWHTVRYDGIVDGNYLYNRCHLIGYQLTGENANEQNHITGTRYLNIEGMLPFENMVADYVQETDCHVLYRVTPIFEDSNLLASGVLMEGYSVEDDGEDICFCVYAYNVQPGIYIDYATGDSALIGNAPPEQPSTAPAPSGSMSSEEVDYILNTNTKKFHLPSCSSADDIKESNREEYHGAREDLVSIGYAPCKRCNP